MKYIKVEAVSKHGKNRIREHGSLWEVRKELESCPCKGNRPAVRLHSLDGNWWRWVSLSQDKDFKLLG